MLQEHYKNITRLLQEHYNNITRTLQVHYMTLKKHTDVWLSLYAVDQIH